jgi:DNA-binding NarL/FixJ family response regulator
LKERVSLSVPDIFIADDSEPWLKALRAFFAGDSRFRVVGHARDYVETLRQVPILNPDVVLADLRMPGAFPEEERLATLTAVCKCPVIVMSSSADAETHEIAKAAGASHLVDKTKLYETLIPTIGRVLSERRTQPPR